MFRTFTQSWKFATTSYKILWRHKRLLWLPVLASLAAGLVLLSFAAPLFLTGTVQGWMAAAHDGGRLPTEQKIMAACITFLFYFCNYFVIVFFNSALVAAAMQAIAGDEVSIGQALRVASRRVPQIIGWALLSAVIGTVLRSIENSHERAGQFVAAILGSGWTVMTYFVVPVIVVDGVGPVQAIKNSLSLLKAQWGTALTGNFSLGLIGFLLVLPLYLLAGGLVALGVYSHDALIFGVCVAGAVLLGAMSWAISGAADMIFKALLFSFATGRTLPAEVSTDDFTAAFAPR